MIPDRRIIIAGLVAVALLVLLAVFGWHEWSVSRGAKTQARIATSQAGAALASGQDASNTVGNRMEADASEDTTTRTNADANRKAEGGNVVVAAPATRTGVAGLCRRAAYRHDPKCLQHTDPR